MQTDAKLRILIAEDAKQGFTAPEVATCTGFSRRAVQDGVARYTLEHPVAAADFLAVDRRARQAKPLIELAVFREVASIDINA